MNEISFTGLLTVSPTAMQPFTRQISDVVSMSGNNYVHNKMQIPVGNLTAATALEMGAVTSPHWAWFKNLDGVNFVTIRNGNTGAALIRLYPGIETAVPIDPGATLFAAADTGACLLEYMVAQL